jgi:hypothetical protein
MPPVTIAPAGIVGAASSEEIQIAIEGELVEQPQTAERPATDIADPLRHQPLAG